MRRRLPRAGEPPPPPLGPPGTERFPPRFPAEWSVRGSGKGGAGVSGAGLHPLGRPRGSRTWPRPCATCQLLRPRGGPLGGDPRGGACARGWRRASPAARGGGRCVSEPGRGPPRRRPERGQLRDSGLAPREGEPGGRGCSVDFDLCSPRPRSPLPARSAPAGPVAPEETVGQVSGTQRKCGWHLSCPPPRPHPAACHLGASLLRLARECFQVGRFASVHLTAGFRPILASVGACGVSK